MEKIWLKSYQAGVPAEIDVNEFRSVGDLFENGATGGPE
jgi:long-chain acyl-CoA synthetase